MSSHASSRSLPPWKISLRSLNDEAWSAKRNAQKEPGMPDGLTMADSFIRLLQERAEKEPAAAVYRWLSDGEREARSLSCADLELRARTIGAALREEAGSRPRALLLYPPGLDFIEALFGCFYAGVVAIPAYA